MSDLHLNDLMSTDKEYVEAPQDIAKDEKREKLKQEILFDKAVYGGISYAAQAATGIALLRWLKYGSGKAHFEKAARWLGPKIFNRPTIEEAAKEVSTPLIVSTMIMVGNTFMLPVKMLENRKVGIVKWLHERDVAKQEAAGNPQTEEEKAHDAQLFKELEAQPTQSWKSLLGGRAFGLAAVFAATFAIGNSRNEAMQKYSADAILKGADAIGLKKLAKNETVRQYFYLGFVDLFYSAVATAGLYLYSHTIAPPKKDKTSTEPGKPGIKPHKPTISEELTELMVMNNQIPDIKPKTAKPTTAEVVAAPQEELPAPAANTNFTDKVTKKPSATVPSEIHTKRLAAQQKSDDVKSWDRSPA